MRTHHPYTLLLVENEAIIAMHEKMMLQSLGYKVLISYSGENAISQFRKRKPIDLILMDINLGNGLDGIETTKKILKIKQVPIFFLTSCRSKEALDMTRKKMTCGYIMKDNNFISLDQCIQAALQDYSRFKIFN